MTTKACDAYKLLHGVFCAYKPPGAGTEYVLTKLKANICKDLNSYPSLPKLYLDVDRSSSEISVNVRPSYADNVLVSGPKYQKHNIKLNTVSKLSNLASGVLIVCINERDNLSLVLKRLNFTKCYHLKGVLGMATTNFYIDSKVIAKAKFENVTRVKFEKILNSYQSVNQRKIFDLYGFSLKSQEAYDFAIKGLYRPTFKGPPIIYSLNIIDFEPPNFTIEVQCIHETETHLLNLIHNLGLNLKCYATCAGIRCLRHGCFHLEHTLTKKQWNLDEILNNMKLCLGVLQENYPQKVRFSPAVGTQLLVMDKIYQIQSTFYRIFQKIEKTRLIKPSSDIYNNRLKYLQRYVDQYKMK